MWLAYWAVKIRNISIIEKILLGSAVTEDLSWSKWHSPVDFTEFIRGKLSFFNKMTKIQQMKEFKQPFLKYPGGEQSTLHTGLFSVNRMWIWFLPSFWLSIPMASSVPMCSSFKEQKECQGEWLSYRLTMTWTLLMSILFTSCCSKSMDTPHPPAAKRI